MSWNNGLRRGTHHGLRRKVRRPRRKGPKPLFDPGAPYARHPHRSQEAKAKRRVQDEKDKAKKLQGGGLGLGDDGTLGVGLAKARLRKATATAKKKLYHAGVKMRLVTRGVAAAARSSKPPRGPSGPSSGLPSPKQTQLFTRQQPSAASTPLSSNRPSNRPHSPPLAHLLKSAGKPTDFEVDSMC